jgi:hypothetical protein
MLSLRALRRYPPDGGRIEPAGAAGISYAMTACRLEAQVRFHATLGRIGPRLESGGLPQTGENASAKRGPSQPTSSSKRKFIDELRDCPDSLILIKTVTLRRIDACVASQYVDSRSAFLVKAAEETMRRETAEAAAA